MPNRYKTIDNWMTIFGIISFALILFVLITWFSAQNGPTALSNNNKYIEKKGGGFLRGDTQPKNNFRNFLHNEWDSFSSEIKAFINTYFQERPITELPLSEIGKVLYLNGYKELGREVIEKILLDDPHDVEALIALAEIYQDLGRIEEFKFIFQEILAKSPDNIDAYSALATFFSDMSEIDQARSLFELGVESNPQNIQMRYWYGDFLEKNGLYQEAIKQYLAVLNFNDHDAETFFKLGESYLIIGETDKGNHFFKIASQLSEDFAEVIKEYMVSFPQL